MHQRIPHPRLLVAVGPHLVVAQVDVRDLGRAADRAQDIALVGLVDLERGELFAGEHLFVGEQSAVRAHVGHPGELAEGRGGVFQVLAAVGQGVDGRRPPQLGRDGGDRVAHQRRFLENRSGAAGQGGGQGEGAAKACNSDHLVHEILRSRPENPIMAEIGASKCW